MKGRVIAAAFIGSLCVSQCHGAQQSTTNTNCSVNGQSVNCTSTTAPPPQGGFWGSAAKGAAQAQAAASSAQERDANASADADAQAKAFKEVLDQFVGQIQQRQSVVRFGAHNCLGHSRIAFCFDHRRAIRERA